MEDITAHKKDNSNDFEIKVIKPSKRPPRDIAIIGMSAVFPQSDDIEELWKNLLD
ncbi:MAG: hypothetical protein GY714_09435, partial [Desulfobacterales bacterium]|nr:hypothetical protein [Desulfobacterales bacterium]